MIKRQEGGILTAKHKTISMEQQTKMYGYYRIAAITPAIVPGDVEYNCTEIIRLCKEAVANGAAVLFLPHLAITGSSCGELFFHPDVQKSALDAVDRIAGELPENCVAVIGSPYSPQELDDVWDMFAICANGGEVSWIPRKMYDRRFFGNDRDAGWAEMFQESAAVKYNAGISFSIPFEPKRLDPAELDLISFPQNALPGTLDELRNFAASVSGAAGNVVVVNTACAGESTAGNIPASCAVIAVNGVIKAATSLLQSESSIIYADADFEALKYCRMRSGRNLGEAIALGAMVQESPDLRYAGISDRPYLPETPEKLANFCRETLEIQSFALAHRMKKAYAKKMVLGISGGLDSTLALVVLGRCCEVLGWEKNSIVAVTMPGFGTTGRTKNNALELAKIIGAEIREISIAEACTQHFKDIGHDPGVRNAVYENTQARERTQILMDIANAENGLVIGTGDLSEISMGWCTYNGDQMSMYSLNSTIMKTVIPELLKYEACCKPEMAEILLDVIATPVSPELLPAEDDSPGHKTEEILGAYEIHDFFIWHFCYNGAGKDKVIALAEIAFKGKYDRAEIERCYGIFSRRFFSQQFKRSASPEGVNANAVSLNPGEWRMHSDVSGAIFK